MGAKLEKMVLVHFATHNSLIHIKEYGVEKGLKHQQTVIMSAVIEMKHIV